MSDFKIQFEVFEGPMDLLLFLVKKQEVDIYDVNMTELAHQFLEYLDIMKTLDLDLAGEFIVMASTLMYIKSRELLPVDQQIEDENEEEIEDPRWELIRKLVEYKRFKDITTDLQKLEFEQEKVYTRRPGSIPLDPLPMDNRLEASIFDLIGAVDRVLQQYFSREAAKREIVDDQWSISEKIVVIRHRLGEAKRLKFSELFNEAGSRGEIVATFLALLELVRLKQLLAMQSEVFGEIDIVIAPVEMQRIVPGPGKHNTEIVESL
jgi:segregation and condensation protein A